MPKHMNTLRRSKYFSIKTVVLHPGLPVRNSVVTELVSTLQPDSIFPLGKRAFWDCD